MDTAQPAQKPPAWTHMGRGHLDEKGRIVIPALMRESAFGGEERPEVHFYISPNGHILLQPAKRKVASV